MFVFTSVVVVVVECFPLNRAEIDVKDPSEHF